MIKILLYSNILNACLSVYISKYLSIRFRKRMDNTFPQELEQKRRQKIHANYHAYISALENLSLAPAILLGVYFTNSKFLSNDIYDKIELINWARIMRFIFMFMGSGSIVIGWIRDEKQQNKDTKIYNIDYVISLGEFTGLSRIYSYPTFFFTLINLMDLCLYRSLLAPSTFIYYLYIALFFSIMLSIQWFKPIDKLFREQNIFKTILVIFVPILIAFCIDYFLIA